MGETLAAMQLEYNNDEQVFIVSHLEGRLVRLSVCILHN